MVNKPTYEELEQRNKELERESLELKRTEKALRESEERYRTLVDTIPHGIQEIDTSGVITFVNPAYQKILGYEEGELPGKPIMDFITSDSRRLESPDSLPWLLKEQPTPSSYIGKDVTKDGKVIDIHVGWNYKRDKKGDVTGFISVITDLSELVRAEKALRESEKKYRILAENAADIIWSMDLEGRFTFVSPSVKYVLGHTVEGFKALNLEGVLTPTSYSSTMEAIQKSLTTDREGGGKGYLKKMEIEYLHKDGSTRWCEVTNMFLWDDKNRPIGISGVTRDNTEQKQMAEALRESEEKFRSLFNNAQVGLFRSRISDGKLLECNELFAKMVGYDSHEECLAEYVTSEHYVDLEDRDRMLKEIKEKGKIDVFMAQITRGDGSPFWVSLSAHIFPGRNCIEVVARDITEFKNTREDLQKEKERFRSLIEEAPLGVSLINEDGHYEYVNSKFIEIFGYTFDDIYRGKGWFNQAYPDQEFKKHVVSTWIEIVKKLKPGQVQNRTYKVRCKDGTDKAIRFWIMAMGAGGQLIFYEDITEISRLEAQLFQAKKMEAIGLLAGRIANDFNNLLMGIQGNASLMLLDIDSDHPHYERLKNLEKTGQTGFQLTKQLLDFAGGGRYEVKSTDLNEIVQETSIMFGREKDNLTIHAEYQEGIWMVETDRGQIEQVLLNLYSNAWQSMSGEGEINLHTENIILDRRASYRLGVGPGRYVKISVIDTLADMDDTTQQRIFEPFFTAKEMGRGDGLGLASAYGIIKNHGGIINVYSKKGEGTTFNVYLPISVKGIIEEKELPEEILKGTETILLVDNEDMILDVGRRMLEKMGYRVLTASSGEKAIEMVTKAFIARGGKHAEKESPEPDLVILDMIMPGMDGGETYERIKEVNPGIKTLLSSGYSEIGQVTEILEDGCDGFIQKPFDIKDLAQKLREILEKK